MTPIKTYNLKMVLPLLGLIFLLSIAVFNFFSEYHHSIAEIESKAQIKVSHYLNNFSKHWYRLTRIINSLIFKV
jgi:hypothetical protein